MTQFVPFLWLSNIPLYYTHISHLLCPFVCPWTFRLLLHPGCGRVLQWTLGYTHPLELWFSLGTSPVVGLLDHMLGYFWFQNLKDTIPVNFFSVHSFTLLLNYFLKILRTGMTRPKTQHFCDMLPHCLPGGMWQYSVHVSCWQGWNRKARRIVAVLAGAVTKYHRLGGLENKSVSHSCRGWKSQITGPARLSSGESSFLGLMKATFFLSPYIVERGGQDLPTSSYKTTNPIGLGPHPYDLI